MNGYVNMRIQIYRHKTDLCHVQGLEIFMIGAKPYVNFKSLSFHSIYFIHGDNTFIAVFKKPDISFTHLNHKKANKPRHLAYIVRIKCSETKCNAVISG